MGCSKWISFGKMNWTLLYFLVMSLGIFSDQYGFRNLWTSKNIDEKLRIFDKITVFKKNPSISFIHLPLFDVLGYLLALFPEIAYLLINRQKKKSALKLINKRKESKIEYILRKDDKKKRIIWLLVGLSICVILTSFTKVSLYLSTYYETFFLNLSFTYSIIFNFEFIFISLLDLWILHYKIYRHQIVAVCINMAGITVFFIGIYFFSKNLFLPIEFLLIVFFSGLLHSILMALIDITEKYLIHNKNISPFKLLLFEGFVTLCLYISIIISIVILSGIDEILIFKCKTPREIFNVFVSFIFRGITQMFRILIIKEYTPSHRIISETLSGIFVLTHKLFSEQAHGTGTEMLNNLLYWIFLISYPIRLIACSMYNEIFVLHFCGLNENTVRNIHQRGNEEYKQNEADIYILEEMAELDID